MNLLPLFLIQLSLLLVTAVNGEECGDALKSSTNLCKRWQTNNLCGHKKVQTLCVESCQLCGDHAKRGAPEYMGCFHDTPEAGFKMVFLRSDLTVRSCVDHCLEKRYAYAALQNGMFCMCGNDHSTMTAVTKRDGCTKRCGGLVEACGGFVQNAVYKTAPTVAKRNLDTDAIEELILGKEMVEMLKLKKKNAKPKPVPIVVPKKRDWNFDNWLRNFVRRKHK